MEPTASCCQEKLLKVSLDSVGSILCFEFYASHAGICGIFPLSTLLSSLGSYPIEAVEVMSRICRTAEMALDYGALSLALLAYSKKTSRPEAVASAAVKISLDLNVPLLIVITETGATARYVAKYKPAVPVLTLTPNPKTARQCMVCSTLT